MDISWSYCGHTQEVYQSKYFEFSGTDFHLQHDCINPTCRLESWRFVEHVKLG